MKNATKHADALKSHAKKLLKAHKVDGERTKQEPLWALVRGAMSFDAPDSKVDDVIKAIEREFVDLNELRVATELEVQEMLGARYPGIEKRVNLITQALNGIFEKEHTLSLDRLREVSRRDARQFLRDLPGMTPYVEAYVMLMAFDGHAFPCDQGMLDHLLEEEIVEEGTSLEDAQKFVEHHLKAEEMHPLFVAMRAAVMEGKGRKKVKA
jgi:endonuclease III